MALYRLDDPGPLDKPSLIVALDGWVDAGASATTAASLVGAGGKDVATFDADRLFDYRARRPTLEIADGRLSALTWPEFVIRAVRIADRDVLVLTGPEPDYRWPHLAHDVLEVATTLGVAEWISLGAIPAAVPHTRPVPILGTASRAGLLRGNIQAGPTGLLRVPAALVSVLEMLAAESGSAAVGYFAQVHITSAARTRQPPSSCSHRLDDISRSSSTMARWARKRSSSGRDSMPRPRSTRTPGPMSSGWSRWSMKSGCRPATT